MVLEKYFFATFKWIPQPFKTATQALCWIQVSPQKQRHQRTRPTPSTSCSFLPHSRDSFHPPIYQGWYFTPSTRPELMTHIPCPPIRCALFLRLERGREVAQETEEVEEPPRHPVCLSVRYHRYGASFHQFLSSSWTFILSSRTPSPPWKINFNREGGKGTRNGVFVALKRSG